jgi:hypothetical protein
MYKPIFESQHVPGPNIAVSFTGEVMHGIKDQYIVRYMFLVRCTQVRVPTLGAGAKGIYLREKYEVSRPQEACVPCHPHPRFPFRPRASAALQRRRGE